MEPGRVELCLPGGERIRAISYHPPLPPLPAPPGAPLEPIVAAPPEPPTPVEPATPHPVPVRPTATRSFALALVEAAPCASQDLVHTLTEVAAELGLTAQVAEPEDGSVPSADLTVFQLGCRWAPRLFQPLIARADLIWIIAPPNRWSAVEMRLDQAEFSGWTDMEKVQVITLGQGAPPPPDIQHLVTAALLDPSGPAARQFLARVCGRVIP